MGNVLTIAGREVRSYFVSPVAYAVAAAFLFISGSAFAFLFVQTVVGGQAPTLRDQFGFMNQILLFLSPLLTMRLLAEEQRTGTIELLLTSPVRDIEVALGKFFGALGVLGFILVLTLLYPAILLILGNPDKGPILTGYVGFLLWGATLIGIGLFTSSLTDSQAIAAFLDFAIVLGLWLTQLNLQQGGTVAAGSGNILQDIIAALSPFNHLDNFASGLLDLRDVFYFLSLTAAGIFLTSRVLEVRRWR